MNSSYNYSTQIISTLGLPLGNRFLKRLLHGGSQRVDHKIVIELKNDMFRIIVIVIKIEKNLFYTNNAIGIRIGCRLPEQFTQLSVIAMQHQCSLNVRAKQAECLFQLLSSVLIIVHSRRNGWMRVALGGHISWLLPSFKSTTSC